MTPITPAELRELIDAACITQRDAARRCHAAERTMREWLAGTRTMPIAASELLVLSLVWPTQTRIVQPDADLFGRLVRPEFAALLRATRGMSDADIGAMEQQHGGAPVAAEP